MQPVRGTREHIGYRCTVAALNRGGLKRYYKKNLSYSGWEACFLASAISNGYPFSARFSSDMRVFQCALGMRGGCSDHQLLLEPIGTFLTGIVSVGRAPRRSGPRIVRRCALSSARAFNDGEMREIGHQTLVLTAIVLHSGRLSCI